MKISWTNDKSGRSGLVAHDLESFDTYPVVSEFWMDASPTKNWADRAAVAATLVFGQHMGGRFHAPFAMSSAVASAISRFSCNGPIVPTNVSSGAGTLTWLGGLELALEKDAAMGSERINTLDETRRIGLNVVRSDLATGRFFSFDRLTLSSNAWLHAEQRSGVEQLYPFLAVAVLFAADLQVSTIVCGPGATNSDGQIAALVDLLGSVGLGLEFDRPEPAR
ncbi:hypothetical protein [Pseudarthrobacter sp. PvP090]|uniref:hypothetical protein n=1 Tax=Pseudarthrobacter sp. PvP090 TaxID=3156393 RepID=UPI003390F31C